MMMEVYESGEICSSMKKAVLSLIFKKGNKRDLNNYRPISTTSSDYKILVMLANRMQTVLDKLISPEQTAYMKGRYNIGSNC